MKIQNTQIKNSNVIVKITATYRYWKFLVTEIANPLAENNAIWQIGEFKLKYFNNNIDFTGATASSTAGAMYSGSESPANAIDGNPASKLCMQGDGGGSNGLSGLGHPLLIDMGKSVTATGMSYFKIGRAHV